MARLKGIQESEHYPHSDFLQNLENSLQIEYNNFLKIEDDYWNLEPESPGSKMGMQTLSSSTSWPLTIKEKQDHTL